MDVNLEPGMVLGGTYRLVSVIGRGGMGEVWRAKHERLPKEVAVKVLLRVPMSGDTASARFRREAEIASRLGHPNIVEILDFNVLPEGVPYMVLELLQGTSLRERLDRGPIPLQEAAPLVRQIGSALAAAHALGIVHRDLKPENIFLVNEPGSSGPTVRAKVLDFGISKIIGDTALTMDREVLGTPFYMSPEQAAGRRDQVDGRTDQFALGCIAYEMLSGKLPFSGQTIMEVLGAIFHAEPESIEKIVPGLPATVYQAINTALAKSPQDRFPSIRDFTDTFCAFMDPVLLSSTSQAFLAGGKSPDDTSSNVLPSPEEKALSSAATAMISTDAKPGEGDRDVKQSVPSALVQGTQDLATSQTAVADSSALVLVEVEQSGDGKNKIGPDQAQGDNPAAPTEVVSQRPRLGRYAGIAAALALVAALGILFFQSRPPSSKAPMGKPGVPPRQRDSASRSNALSPLDTMSAKGIEKTKDASAPNREAAVATRQPEKAPKKTVSQSGHSARTSHRSVARKMNPHTNSKSPRGTASQDTALMKQYRIAMASAKAELRAGHFSRALGQADQAKRICLSIKRTQGRGSRGSRHGSCSTQAAWGIFTMAACGDRRQKTAQSAFRRLRGHWRKKTRKFCAGHNVVVGQD